ncbi:hypothetical protein FA13DRAFT_1722195 [Coprinellus micaceus]|uniref:Helicase ATP-binding domain-containing protein n=1 Tax=Coprinellus micaceus TaxID=71717 RepID=A0A4Y7RR57_COPMI|nr:hypothetical protein FA13DRAFT_1722195 [Coprinellus micaceus]
MELNPDMEGSVLLQVQASLQYELARPLIFSKSSDLQVAESTATTGAIIDDSKEHTALPLSQPTRTVHFEHGLIRDAFLTEVGLAINPVHKLFICISCDSALTRKTYRYHLKTKENITVTQDIAAGIEELSDIHNIVAEFPPLHTNSRPIPYIAGLKIDQKSGCPLCMYTAVHKRVQKHIKDEHPGTKATPLVDIPSQVLNLGIAPTNFRIIPPAQTWFLNLNLLNQPTLVNMAPPDNRMVSPWLLRTGFHEYVQGHDITQLVNLCSLPSKSETEKHMQTLHTTVLEYLNGGTKLIKQTDPLTLQMLNSSDPTKDGINHTPLHEHHQPETTGKHYALPVVHLLSTLLRGGFQGFAIATSPTLSTALEAYKVNPTVDCMHQALLALWTVTWQQPEGNLFLDPTICFLAIHSLRKDGHFLEPKDMTGIIAKLCRAIRLVVLTEIHKRAGSGVFPSLLDAFKSLSCYTQEGHQTTFHVLRFLQHYATAITLKTVGLPKIIWPFRDEGRYDTMLFMGNLISLEHIRATLIDIERQITVLWEQNILRGLKLHAPHSIIQDNLRDTSNGYSFLTSPQFSAFANRFASHLFDNMEIKSSFVHASDGSTSQEINVAGFRAWLLDLSKLEGLLMLSIEIKNGSPIRRIALVRNYTKNTNNRQADSLIPSCMAAFDADMIIQLHTIARPIAQFAVAKMFPDNLPLVNQYHEMVFMDFLRPFTTDSGSNLMATIFSKHVGWKVKIAAFRQMIIGFRKNNHLPMAELDIQEETMRLVYAQQSGHTASTEDRTYGLSPDLVEGVADATMELYLQSSLDWQYLLATVPGGVDLPYWQCTTDQHEKLVAEGHISMRNTAKGSSGDNCAAQHTANLIIDLKTELQSTWKALSDSVARLNEKMDTLNHISGSNGAFKTREEQRSEEGTTLDNVFSSENLQLVAVSHQNALPNETLGHIGQQGLSHKRSLSLEEAEDNSVQPVLKRVALDVPVFDAPKDMLDCLRRLISKDAQWRNGDQRTAVASMLTLRRDLIIVLRTGLGKTAIALLPPMVEDGITVVVVPLVVLLKEWETRLKHSLIPFDIFLHDRQTPIRPSAKVVLVSSDTARFDTWRQAIATLHNIHPVVRMIIDEAHYYFTDVGFRKEGSF